MTRRGPDTTNFPHHTTTKGAAMNTRRDTAVIQLVKAGVHSAFAALIPHQPRGSSSSVRAAKLATATTLVLSAFAFVSVTSSSAAPAFTGTFPNSFTFSATSSIKFESIVGSASTVTCKPFTGSGGITSRTGGTFTSELSCAHSIVNCKTEAGNAPKFEGSFELVNIKPGSTGVVFSPETLYLKCGPHTYVIAGRAIATISPVETSTTEFTVNFETSGHTQKIRECEFGAQCGGLIQLEEAIDTGNLSAAGLEANFALAAERATTIEPKAFFTGTFPNSFTFSATSSIKFESIVGSASTVTCKPFTGSGGITSRTGGTFTSELSCAHSIVNCKTEAGNAPKFEGSFELVNIKPGSTGVVFSPETLYLKCGPHTYVIAGRAIATISPVETSTTEFTVNFETSGHTQKIRECELGAQCGGLIQLEEAIDTGNLSAAGLEANFALAAERATAIE